MTVKQGRVWLIVSSLVATGIVLLFFLLAPALGYPLEFGQSIRVLEIILPVFLGYLGSASLFVFNANRHQPDVRLHAGELAALLIRGPIVVCGIALTAVIHAGRLARADAAAE